MKDIKNFEGIYAITADGRVWSYKRKAFLVPEVLFNGYERVSLCNKGTKVRVRVHRLVAETYLGIAPEQTMQVNHIDGNKRNNNVFNLEWVTPQYNIQHYHNCLKRR